MHNSQIHFRRKLPDIHFTMYFSFYTVISAVLLGAVSVNGVKLQVRCTEAANKSFLQERGRIGKRHRIRMKKCLTVPGKTRNNCRWVRRLTRSNHRRNKRNRSDALKDCKLQSMSPSKVPIMDPSKLPSMSPSTSKLPTMTPCKPVTRIEDCNNNEENYYMKDDGKFYVAGLPVDPNNGCCSDFGWKGNPAGNLIKEICWYNERYSRKVYRGNCL